MITRHLGDRTKSGNAKTGTFKAVDASPATPPRGNKLMAALGKAMSGKRRPSGHAPWYFLLPAAAIFAFIVLLSSARSIELAFTNWNGVSPTATFTGLSNFKKIYHDPVAIGAIAHTVFYAVAITIIQNLIGLLLALGLHSKLKSRNILRTIFFLPVLIMPVAAGFLWQYLLAPSGALNAALNAVGLHSLTRIWLGNPHTALAAVLVVVIWQYSGYSMVIYLAGLEGIPQELLDAAAVDGASSFRRFWSVTRPLLGPALAVSITLCVTGGLKMFDQVQALTQGGPANATQSISTLIYLEGFSFGRFGYSVALSVILALIVAIAGFTQFRLIWRRGQ